METLKSLLNQAMMIWKESTGAGRLGIALLGVIFVSGILTVGYWSAQPQYVILVSDLEPKDIGKVADKLDAAGITYVYEGSSTIKVDQRRLAKAKTAAANAGVRPNHEDLEPVSIWDDPTAQREIVRRNKERQLEAGIMAYDNIDTAEVHLGLAEKQVFLRNSVPKSASVILGIARGSSLDESQAIAISKVVANSEPGLSRERVVITDTSGREYTTDDTYAHLGRQDQYRVARNYEFAAKAEEQLFSILGIGNASVQVSADFDFRNGTTTTERIDPESKSVLKEIHDETKTTVGDQIPSGVAGTGSNAGASSASSLASEGVVTEKERREVENGYDRILTTETHQDPVLESISVSVLVNKAVAQDENNAIPEGLKEMVEMTVMQAIGMKEERDQINVAFHEFVDPIPEDAVAGAPIPWEQINEIIKNVSLGLAAIVALFISLRALKKFQLDSGPATEVAPQADGMNQLSEMVQQNPEIFSKIIANWSNSDAATEVDGPARRAA